MTVLYYYNFESFTKSIFSCPKITITVLKSVGEFFQVPVLSLVGEFSPFVDDTILLNGKLNPESADWMKVLVKLFSFFFINFKK